METFILQSNEIDSLGACSYGTLRSVDLLPRLANYLSIALDTIEVRFENAGQTFVDFQQSLLSEYRHLVAESVEFHELNADDYGSAYVDSVEMDAQEIIVSLFDALDSCRRRISTLVLTPVMARTLATGNPTSKAE